jgi:hypothetical protein
MASYDATLSRVRLSMTAVRTALGADGAGLVERSLDQVQWTAVRGGEAVPLTTSAAPLDDYEFAPDLQNFYRVTPSSGVYTDSITPDLGGDVWLKSLRYPFLNLPVEVTGVGDIVRPSRGSTFDVVGRNLPVAVTTARGGRNWTLTVFAEDATGAAAIDALLTSGDVLLLQVPAGSDIPAGYYLASDTDETISPVSGFRSIDIPLAEAAAPGADVTGTTITWQGVIDAYATWSDLIAANATWLDVEQSVGSPADVIVS